jgi:phage tail-like protein
MNPDAYPSCRFYVQIDEIGQAVFTEVSGLQLETEVFDYEEGGYNSFPHRFPGRTKMGNLTLKRGMTSSNEFFKWYMEIARGQITRHNLSIIMYDSAGNEVTRWHLMQAYPVKWIGPQFTADSNNPAIETLELAHDGLDLG